MVTAITNSISVSVVAHFEGYATPEGRDVYYFSYTIKITNLGDEPVQLRSREWIIKESTGENRIVKGSGVVGEQPFLAAGESFTYTSSCMLSSGIGTMEGFYYLEKQTLNGKEAIKVKIPRFQLECTELLN